MNNYKQALKILAGENALQEAMKARGIKGQDFTQWLIDEKEYLVALGKEPAEETLQLDYFQKLLELCRLEYVPLLHAFPQSH